MRPWPNPERPGEPLNPEKGGWHWLDNNRGQRFPMQWQAKPGYWIQDGDELLSVYPEDAMWMTYLAPCPFPEIDE